MTAASTLATISNGRAIDQSAVQACSASAFHETILAGVAAGQRVASLFAMPAAQADALRFCAVLADDRRARINLATTIISGDSTSSLTPLCPQVHLFEREIGEQFGVKFTGHPWFKPVRYQRSMRSGSSSASSAAVLPGVTDFYRVEGEEVHEVAVGPVHAGVIEPGHFRFQCHGEEVFHLEIALGYQHRGVEPAMIGGPNTRSIHYAETLAGDTTIGHTTAYCQIIEALTKCRATPRAQTLRGIALELERLANHVGDLGALANDVGFLPTASYCGRIRGDFLNMTALLCGNRFGRGLICPGGVGFDADSQLIDELLKRLAAAEVDCKSAIELLWDSASVMARFEETGRVSQQSAVEMGLVGVAARACGLARDVRVDHPSGIFSFVQVPAATSDTGDVYARALVRWVEMQRSMAFVREQLQALAPGPIREMPKDLAPNQIAVALVEGWRGEICHVAVTGHDGRFKRYKVVDPSFHNWTGLALALRNQQISDFPLCNKSFNLSYCGHDL